MLAGRIAAAAGHGETVLLALTGRDRAAAVVLGCLIAPELSVPGDYMAAVPMNWACPPGRYQ